MEKKRFFVTSEDDDDLSIIDEVDIIRDSKRIKADSSPPKPFPDRTEFETQVLAIIPEIKHELLAALYIEFKDTKNAVMAAVNHFFENQPIEVSDSEPDVSITSSIVHSQVIPIFSQLTPKAKTKETSNNDVTKEAEWKRFIGSIQVNGMATRPTLRPLKYGTELQIIKLDVSSKKNDTNMANLRFVEPENNNREIGRLSKDITEIVYALYDVPGVVFQSTVVFCDQRLSIGDSFYVQLDVFLTHEMFKNVSETQADAEGLRGFKASQREDYEQHTHLAMIKLFNKINLMKSNSEEAHDVIDLEESNDEIEVETTHEESSLNLNQLQNFYKATQSVDSIVNLPETTPRNFKLNLRKYQSQGLTWMLRREKELSDVDSSSVMNPLWKEFWWPKDRSWVASHGEKETDSLASPVFYANLYSGEFSLTKPVLTSMIKGGILADEMGLGKTISTLSLITQVPEDLTFKGEPGYAYKTTLVIVPMSLLSQWHSEFTKASKGRCEVFYGNNISNLKSILTGQNAPMVLLTTYGTVQSGVGPLFDIKYFRIVIDEGHFIRNRMNKTSKAIFSLQSSRKWILTGTPIINRLDDLYSLVKFLDLQPWSNISYWKTFVSQPFEKKQYQQAMDVVSSVLEPVILRRTKAMKDVNGKPLVELPPKEVVIERIKFSETEQALYGAYLDQAETSVKDGLIRGDLLKKYSTILVHILRLRQVCCHPELVGTQDDMEESDIQSYIKSESKKPLEIGRQSMAGSNLVPIPEEESECSICTERPTNPVYTTCNHIFCSSCIDEYMEFQKGRNLDTKCPLCRSELRDIFKYTDGRFVLRRALSSKEQALLSHLKRIRDTSPNGEHVVVFSQFSSFLDIMSRDLHDEGFTVYKFHGKLGIKERKAVLDDFEVKTDEIKVLLLSLKAGGVGLNLTHASRAFMMDPWWSPGVEDQAIDRIHRIGQTNHVKVIRFITEGTIEEKMLKIQERKRTIGEVVDADEEERRERRVEEIKMLFES